MTDQHRFFDVQCGGKRLYELGKTRRIPWLGRFLRLPESGKIGGDHTTIGGEMIDDQTVGLGRGTPSVQQQDDGTFALVKIGDVQPIDGNVFHANSSFVCIFILVYHTSFKNAKKK